MPTQREALSKAIQKSTAASETGETDTSEDVDEQPEVEASAETVEAPEAEQVEALAVEEQEERAAKDETRDEKGRFRPRPAQEQQQEKQTAKPDKAVPQQVEQPQQQTAPTSQFKAPQNWKPEAREALGKISDPAVRDLIAAEATRIDGEVRRVMQESAGHRNIVRALQQTIGPYETMIRAAQRGQEYNPLAVVGSLLETAATLRSGTPAEKSDIIAELIETYGIPGEAIVAHVLRGLQASGADETQLQAFDAAVARMVKNPGARAAAAPRQQDFRDPRLDEFLQRQEQETASRREEAMRRGAAEVDAFAQSHEFYNDVREDMATLMETASRARRPMSLQEAYDTALLLPHHKGIQGILKQRADAAAVKTKTAAAKKAKQASSSLRGSPTGTAGAGTATEGGSTRRAALEQAVAESRSR